MGKYLLAFDQGTTSSRAILFGHDAKIAASVQREFKQSFPKPGWVEHDPGEIWSSQLATAQAVMTKAGITPEQVEAIGITNQRETTVVWDRRTGKPVYPAIVWQDRRTAPLCETLKRKGYSDLIREKTGLVPDAYFSGTKIRWILDEVAGARQLAEAGHLAFGTIDSWLLFCLTGNVHATDYSNASRTLLYNIRERSWDAELCNLLRIPQTMLPEVKDSSGFFGITRNTLFGREIPITAIAGDQQAALFGQLCHQPGMAKNTYGTGCFMLLNTGDIAIESRKGLLTTIAWGLDGRITYALEGSVFIAGAVIQWLRDGLEIIDNAKASEVLAGSVEDSGGVCFVPAFSGLGTPYWDMYARGSIFGLTRGTTRAHLVRAALESIAYQSRDVLQTMIAESQLPLSELRVDGGASANAFLMQFQSDILNTPIHRPGIQETTALGAAYLAGLATGFWTPSELEQHWQLDRAFHPQMTEQERKAHLNVWARGVERAKHWIEP